MRKVSEKDIIEFVENRGFVFIDFINYCGAKSKIKVICPNGHAPYEVSYSTITRKNKVSCGCPDKIGYNAIKKYVEEYNYELLTNEEEYKGASIPIKLKCENGHIYEFSLNNFQQGKRCGKCLKSNGEQEISRILDKYSIKYIYNYRFSDSIVKNKPFDFLLVDKNIRILYWDLKNIEDILIKELNLK